GGCALHRLVPVQGPDIDRSALCCLRGHGDSGSAGLEEIDAGRCSGLLHRGKDDLIMPDKKIVRVALLGAESTGKSTLAAALAQRYDTVWVPEYLREFVETTGRTPQEQEQFPIAATQVQREEAALRKAKSYLF